MSQARQLHIRLYLEGLRVPVRQVSVYGEANKPARATIQIPPTSKLEDLPPKTHVLIFYTDLLPDAESIGDDIRAYSKRMKLLFEGEVVGFGWQQSANGSLSAVIHAEDLSNYFSAPAYYFANNFIEQYALQSLAFLLGDTPFLQVKHLSAPNRTGLTSEIELQLLLVNNKSIARAFREIFKATSNLNKYFRDANGRIRLVDVGVSGSKDRFGFNIPVTTGRIALKDDPESALLYGKHMNAIVDLVVHDMDIVLPIREVMRRLTELLFYQIWPQLCPSFEEDETAQEVLIPSRLEFPGFTADETGAAIDLAPEAPQRRLMNFILKPSTFFTIPPRFNVLFPGSYQFIEASRNFMEEPTRIRMRIVDSARESVPIMQAFYGPQGLQPALAALYGKETTARAIDIARRQAVTLPDPVARLETLAGLEAAAQDLVRNDNPTTAILRVLLTEGEGVPAESDETLKGIIALETRMPYGVFINRGIKNTDDQTRYFSQVAEFQLFLAQHVNRVIQVNSDFNPNLALGFPILVLQRSMGPKFGEIGSMTHTLINEAGGSTTITIIYAHDRDVVSVDGQPAGINRVAPFWFNKAYLPQNVDAESFEANFIDPRKPKEPQPLFRGRGAFRHFFGASGDAFWRNFPTAERSGLADGPEGFGFSKRTAAETLLDYYNSLEPEGRLAFMEEFTRRRVATLEDMAAFLDFKIESEDRLTGRPLFRDSVRLDVEAIREDLREPAVRV